MGLVYGAQRYISIHAPPRGATTFFRYPAHAHDLFQFTPLREGRRQETPGCGCPHISIHAPPRGATRYEGGQRTPSVAFQFTPLREGRLSRSVLLALPRSISIHAPPRGATGNGECPEADECISIHAPPRGATLRVFLCLSAPVFQFTPLREGRRNERHQPAFREHFNSRPSARGDGVAERHRRSAVYFNSRPSARGDSSRAKRKLCPRNFNSRPSARGDGMATSKGAVLYLISIHAPPRGATLAFTLDASPMISFQFTPLREGRRCAGKQFR